MFKITLRTIKFIKLLTLYLKFPQPSVPYCWMTGSYFFDFTSSEKNTICWNLFCCRILKLRLFFHGINLFQHFSSIQFIINILYGWTQGKYAHNFSVCTSLVQTVRKNNVQELSSQRWLAPTWFLSSWEERTACKAEQIHKKTTIFTQNGPRLSFWVKMVLILWICSALQGVLSFSAWEKSRDSTRNSQKLVLRRFSGKNCQILLEKFLHGLIVAVICQHLENQFQIFTILW